ncbi:DUF4955 domain-containing protein [Algibacter mikhailovii]|uniref:DUF4955 domain-containing protein n=1 Tax=Algibacter mikhailovii TaxID=425498 RepID=A0A918R5V7_9FLAO|nr:DUF4955 domain-containing protein [Algibacter mikhailovii]GGZ86470.1 hypothetical protein GCM10007028_25690 [Algibacter mikhailovii]
MKLFSLIILVFVFFNCNAQEKTVWEDFVASRKTNKTPILPDFSYAGYMYSEIPIPHVDYKVFDVTHFGAIPNDLNSDKKAIKAAINAATKNGQGIIFFPKGKYYINTGDDDNSIITIASSKIVFRGEDQANTILFFDKDLPPLDPTKLWTCPSAIKTTTLSEDELLTTITNNSKRESHTIEVEDASKIKKGDWLIITLKDNSPELITQDIGPLVPDKKWTSILNDGVQINERHQVASVKGNIIQLVSPIHYDIDTKYKWHVYSFSHINHVGFENITFEGHWTKKFVHHKNAQHDGGWSILSLTKAVNSWIKDCTFINVNNAASISSSAATTALNIKIKGHISHAAIHAAGGSTNILLAKIDDLAGMHHSTGVGGGSTTGTVIWRSTYPEHTCFESHSSQPRCSLFDNVKGGFFAGRAGGAIKNLPTHGRYLVLWNYEETDEPETNFDFIAKDSDYWRIVPPIIVGFHGSGTTFNKNEVQIIESLGKPVKPESLFEEQLKLRLGKLPEWIINYN